MILSQLIIDSCVVIGALRKPLEKFTKMENLIEGKGFTNLRRLERSVQAVTPFWVVGKRGPCGGYALTSDGKNCSLYDVVHKLIVPEKRWIMPFLTHWRMQKPDGLGAAYLEGTPDDTKLLDTGPSRRPGFRTLHPHSLD